MRSPGFFASRSVPGLVVGGALAFVGMASVCCGSSDDSPAGTSSSRSDGGGAGDGGPTSPPSTKDAGADGSDGSALVGCSADAGTDPKNCGACGHDCLGATCTDGVCDPEELWSPSEADAGTAVFGGISVDAQNVYWLDEYTAPGNNQMIFGSLALASVSADSLAARVYPVPMGFGDSNPFARTFPMGSDVFIYDDECCIGDAFVDVVPATESATAFAGAGEMVEVVAIGSTIFFHGPVFVGSNTGASFDDAHMTYFTHNYVANDATPLSAVAANGTSFFFARGYSGMPYSFSRVDPSAVHLDTTTDNPITGSTIYTASTTGQPVRLAADDASLYAYVIPTNDGTSTATLLAVDLASASVRALATDVGDVRELPLAVDDSFVYWVGQGRTALQRVPKAGGSVVAVVTGTETITSFTVDAMAVYWTTATGVHRRVK